MKIPIPARVMVFFVLWIFAVAVLFVWGVATGALSFFAKIASVAFAGGAIAQEPFVGSVVPEIMRFVVAMFIAMFPTGMAIGLIMYGRGVPLPKSRVDKLLRLPWTPLGMRFLGAMCVEEILFRWFPLTVLFSVMPWMPRAAIIIFSSGVFAVIHRQNYRPQERHIALILPQFIAGFFLSYAYLRWGFGVAVAAHAFFDIVLLVPGKVIYPHKKALQTFREIVKTGEQPTATESE